MKYLDAVFLQVVGWAVALVLAWLAKQSSSVNRWLSASPWRLPFVAAVLVSGLLNAVALWLITSNGTSALNDAATRQQVQLDALKAGLLTWGGGNKGVKESDNECNDGSYVVSISQKSVSYGEHGVVESFTITCRPLNVR